MPGLVPGIPRFWVDVRKTWMPGNKPGHDEVGAKSSSLRAKAKQSISADNGWMDCFRLRSLTTADTFVAIAPRNFDGLLKSRPVLTRPEFLHLSC